MNPDTNPGATGCRQSSNPRHERGSELRLRRCWIGSLLDLEHVDVACAGRYDLSHRPNISVPIRVISVNLWRNMRLTISLALVLLVGLSSCTRNPQPSKKQLTLAVVSGVEGDALKQAARDYEAQTGIHIEIAAFPYTNLFEKELIDLKARTGAYDLIMLDDPWFPRFANEQLLTELTPLLQKRGQSGPDSDFVDTSVALCRHPYQSGPLYALPYVGNSQLFFYRKDLFEKYSLKAPETWNDVLAAAKTIHEKETTGANGGRIHGYVMRAAQGNAAVADFMPIFWAFGGEMFGPDGKPAVNSPEGIAALEFMIELGKYSPPVTRVSMLTKLVHTCCREPRRCRSTGPRGSVRSAIRRSRK